MIINIKCKTPKKIFKKRRQSYRRARLSRRQKFRWVYLFIRNMKAYDSVYTIDLQAMYSQINLYVFCLYSKTLLMYSHLSLFDVTPLPLSLPLPPFPQTLNHSHTIYISIIYIRSIPMKRVDY